MQVRSGDGAAGDKRYLTYRRYLTPSQNSKIGEVLAGDCTVTAALASLLYSVADVSIIFKTQSWMVLDEDPKLNGTLIILDSFETHMAAPPAWG